MGPPNWWSPIGVMRAKLSGVACKQLDAKKPELSVM
jgi:hypothetical protein